ncbi:dihydrofolate reductase family protein [Pedobacter nyackensis]|uniref:dihydrofolate reductase family protein n=1 Tax=Pedobacter nyackensis TaxID=475255 RepID=UPI00292DAF8F|nr:dihydrofolate reductase family protein [Pedobacter nyackensis]
MRKIIAGINMTLDGFCDHTAIDPDEEIHQHYADLLSNGDVILYGRITYQLMQYWQALVKNPSGEKSMDNFALVMDGISKIVFSRTLKDAGWESAKLANRSIEEEALALRQQSGKDILVGSRSLIRQLLKLNLVDELQLCIHPVIAGNGLPLFENINDRTDLKLIKTKTFSSGAIILYYEPSKNNKVADHLS